MALNLLSVYDEMTKQAEATSAQPEAQDAASLETEVLQKYAEAAVNLLTEEKGENGFTEEEAIKVASELIEMDKQLIKEAEEAEVNDAMQKVAEAHELGTIMAEAFLSRLSQENN